ncbi:MAG TPA: hypothetical protein VFD73_20555, partial [Gemmatimonadales bacterium]|nr:hypothetical protein [Gemmatimonadales bacterium]
HDWTESLDAFRRVVALNPRLVPAWEHIGDLATGRDRAEHSRALANLYALGYPPPGHPGFERFVRLVYAVDSAGGVIPSAQDTLADSMARFTAFSAELGPGNDGQELAIASPLDLLQRGFPVAQLDMNRRRLALSNLQAPVRAANLAGSAWAWATRGQWDSALVLIDQATVVYPGAFGWNLLPVESYGLAVLGAWLGTVDPIEADRRRPGALAAVARATDEAPAWSHGTRSMLRDSRGKMSWLDGLLGFARRDRRAIQTARAEAAKSGFFRADLIDRSLTAFDRALGGDRKGAGRDLAKLEEECIGEENCPSMTPHIAVQRMMAAEWLREAGDAEAARRLLRWQDALWLGWPWTFNDGVSAPAFLMRAQIEEQLGS